MLTHKSAPIVLVVVGVVVFGVLGPKWPKDQTLNVVLGDAASRVEEVRVRYAEPETGEWTREATFRWASPAAPRIVRHEMRLPDGEYDVEIEIATNTHDLKTVRRHVALHGGGTTSVDVAEILAPHPSANVVAK
jgi:hypothetical protein